MLDRKNIFILFFSFIFGLWSESLLFFGWSLVGWLALVGFCCLFCTFFLPNFRRVLLLFFVCSLVASGGVVRIIWESGRNNFQDSVRSDISLSGIVVAEPTLYDNSQGIILREKEADKKILVYLPLYPKLSYGDELRVSGQIEKREFPLAGNIFYQIGNAQAEVLGHNQGNFFLAGLLKIKNRFLTEINELIPAPESALAGGLIFGGRQSLDQEWQEKFRQVGLSHIIVLSGYNLAVVATTIFFIFGLWSRRWGILFGSVGVVAFTLMAGAGAAATRAAVMALIAIFAKAVGRVGNVATALLLSGLALLIWHPFLLVYDLGFQLSFLATFGIIYVEPWLEKKFSRVPKTFALRETTATTISAQVMVAPWILYKMQTFSWLALPVNLLVLPIIPATMFFGFMAGLSGISLPFLAPLFAWPAHALLTYIFLVTGLFS